MGLNKNIVDQILKAQQGETPQKIFRKVIMGQVSLRIIDPFSGDRTEMMVSGVPHESDGEDLEVVLWTPLEVLYFEKANKGLIENGSIVEVTSQTQFTVDRTNALDDASLRSLATIHFFTLKSKLKQITAEVTVQRLYNIAVELNRPAKTLQAIQTRIEEIQQKE